MLNIPDLFHQTPPPISVFSALNSTIEIIEAVSDSIPTKTQEHLRIKHHLAQSVLILEAFRDLHKNESNSG